MVLHKDGFFIRFASKYSITMKKLLTISLLVSIALLYSCGKDDGATVSTNGEFTFNGESYTLTHAYIDDFGENDNGSFDVDITLTSKSVDFESDDISNLSFVYLDLNTSMQNVLEAGTYTYALERDKFVMVDGLVGVNVSADSEGNITGGTSFTVAGGTVTVSVSSDIYTISFTLTGEDDERATGSFTGTLTQQN